MNQSMILKERTIKNYMKKTINQEMAKRKISPLMNELIESDIITSKIISILHKLDISFQ